MVPGLEHEVGQLQVVPRSLVAGPPPWCQIAPEDLLHRGPPERRERSGTAQHRVEVALGRPFAHAHERIAGVDRLGEPGVAGIPRPQTAGHGADAPIAERCDDPADPIPFQHRVRVDGDDDLALALLQGERLGGPLAVVLPREQDPPVRDGVVGQHGEQLGTVLGPVVDDPDLDPAAVVLLPQRGQALAEQPRLLVVAGDDDVDVGRLPTVARGHGGDGAAVCGPATLPYRVGRHGKVRGQQDGQLIHGCSTRGTFPSARRIMPAGAAIKASGLFDGADQSTPVPLPLSAS